MFNIPEDQLPKEWQDEDRVNVLFAPLRSQSVNPKDWNTKITSWKNIIHLYCLNNDIYSFTIPQLHKAFLRHGRPPACLNIVIEELMKNHEIIYLDQFLQTSPQTWGRWATDLLIKKPLLWSFNTLKKTFFSENENKVLVHLGVIREQSQNLLNKIPDNWRNKLINLGELLNYLKKSENNLGDIKLLLHYLENEKKLRTTKLENQSSELKSILIKFGEDNTVKSISEVEIGIYVLEQNENLFLKEVEKLEDEISKVVAEAKTHLSKGHKHLAKNCIRKKHEIEKRLTRKENALHNIQVLLERIRDTHTDAHVWDSYKHALSAFNTTFKETGLNENAVEDVMIKIGEMMDTHDDIQTAMSRPVVDITDDYDLEKELEELVATEGSGGNSGGNSVDNLESEFEKLALNLPDVPSSKIPENRDEDKTLHINNV